MQKKYSTASIPEPVLGDLLKLSKETERSVSFYATKFSREMMVLTKKLDLKEIDHTILVTELSKLAQDGKKIFHLSFPAENNKTVGAFFNEATLRELTQQLIELTLKADNDAKGK